MISLEDDSSQGRQVILSNLGKFEDFESSVQLPKYLAIASLEVEHCQYHKTRVLILDTEKFSRILNVWLQLASINDPQKTTAVLSVGYILAVLVEVNCIHGFASSYNSARKLPTKRK